MKNIILVSLALLIGSACLAQSNRKIAETTIPVSGNCGMCKERIETAARYTKGVKNAEWTPETQTLVIQYSPKRFDRQKLEANIAKVGYQAGDTPADSTAYENLPTCCQYKSSKPH